MSKHGWGNPPIDIEGNSPAAIGQASRAAHLASNWIIAIDAWDYRDTTLLAEMLRRHPVPAELRPVIAAIVSGERTQKAKAAVKLKIPAAHRLVVAGIYAEIKESVIDTTLGRKTIRDYHDIADARKIEVSELRREYQESARKFKSKWAETAGVSVETLENLYLELRDKIKNYPKI